MPGEYWIAPSILSADFSCLKDQLQETEAAGADWIHIDVMDGHFVPVLTMGPNIVEACRRSSKLPIEVHLMIERPEQMLEAFAQAGANRLIVHVETCPHLHRTLQTIRELGCQNGAALNPGTPAVLVEPVLPALDLLLAMTVNPGYSGQKFIPEVLPKIRELRRLLDNLDREVPIEVDGGINAETLPMAWQAGARVFVAASAVYRHPDGIEAGLAALRESIE